MCVNPKYNIKRRLLAMAGDYLKNKYALCIALGCSEKTIDRWIVIPDHFTITISDDKLHGLAAFFNCVPDELINHGKQERVAC